MGLIRSDQITNLSAWTMAPTPLPLLFSHRSTDNMHGGSSARSHSFVRARTLGTLYAALLVAATLLAMTILQQQISSIIATNNERSQSAASRNWQSRRHVIREQDGGLARTHANDNSHNTATSDESPTFRDAFVGGGMTPPEQELLARLYASATSVFEWGMGSSSLIASHAGIERLTAVDSASTWVDKVSGMLAEKNPSYKFWHVDIGPVGMWGRVSTTQFANVKERFPNYSLQVDRVSPPADIYLVDGRFRVACACWALLHGRADSLVLVHDFERPEYHILLTLADKVENEDKLAVLRRKATTADDAILALWEEY